MGTVNHQLRAMYLAGTVSIPPKFPDMATITYKVFDEDNSRERLIQVVAEHRISPKLLITRTFFIEDVSAVFYPTGAAAAKLEAVDFTKGEWLAGAKLEQEALDHPDDPLTAILFVQESARSLLQVEAGLTAAESAEYYPPLPNDRSHNHYGFDSAPGCAWGSTDTGGIN